MISHHIRHGTSYHTPNTTHHNTRITHCMQISLSVPSHCITPRGIIFTLYRIPSPYITSYHITSHALTPHEHNIKSDDSTCYRMTSYCMAQYCATPHGITSHHKSHHTSLITHHTLLQTSTREHNTAHLITSHRIHIHIHIHITFTSHSHHTTFITSHYTTPNHTIPHHTTPHHTTPHHTAPHHTAPLHTTMHYITSCYITSHNIILRAVRKCMTWDTVDCRCCMVLHGFGAWPCGGMGMA